MMMIGTYEDCASLNRQANTLYNVSILHWEMIILNMKVTAEGPDMGNLPLEEMKWNRGCCVYEKGSSTCPTDKPAVRCDNGLKTLSEAL